MQIVSTAWISGTPEVFELEVGLGVHAQHGRAGAAHPLRVFVLQGFNRLPERYLARLREGHVLLEDAGAIAQSLAPRVAGIASRLNRYETFCFLRWLVLREVLAGEPFLHIDLDLFLQPDFAAVVGALSGCSFTSGSPCFLATSDRAWLDAWCEAIEAFDRDPDGLTRLLGYEGTAFRRHIGSDQNLLGALLKAGRLARGDAGPLGRTHALINNPLHPGAPGKAGPLRHERLDGMDAIAGRPLLFWHMQNDFARHVGRHLLLAQEARGSAVPRLEAQAPGVAPTAGMMAFDLLRRLAMERFRRDLAARVLDLDRLAVLFARGPLDFLARGVATRHFILRGEARELFTDAQWWQPGVFA